MELRREPDCYKVRTCSIVFVAGTLPGNQVADSRAPRAGCGMFVSFNFRARSFFPDGFDAEPNLLLFRIHLDDLEIVFLAWLQRDVLAIGVHCFGVMAEAFNTVGNFDECAKAGDPKHFPFQNVPNMMLLEETFPNIGLKLLDPK